MVEVNCVFNFALYLFEHGGVHGQQERVRHHPFSGTAMEKKLVQRDDLGAEG
jgi:hypothetical protein